MTSLAAAPDPLRIVSEPGPRFLGLRVAERNRRVAHRAAAALPARASEATLTVPPGIAITASLVRGLPPAGSWRLRWHPHRPPILWEAEPAADLGTVRDLDLAEDVVLDVSTRGARRRSAWILLRASGKPADGWLSRHVHRKVSRLFSYLLLQVGLTANAATALTFLVGVSAAWLMAQTTHATMIAGAGLFWFASIADGIDGEMARLTLSESSFGEQLDTGVDQATYLFGLGGAILGWYRQGIGPAGIALGATVVVGLPAMLLWGMALVRRARQTRQLFVPTKPIELAVMAAARRVGAAPLRAAAGMFFLFRREAFSLTFFLVSLVTGRRVVYPLLLAAGLTVVATLLLAYRSAIEAELRGGAAAAA